MYIQHQGIRPKKEKKISRPARALSILGLLIVVAVLSGMHIVRSDEVQARFSINRDQVIAADIFEPEPEILITADLYDKYADKPLCRESSGQYPDFSDHNISQDIGIPIDYVPSDLVALDQSIPTQSRVCLRRNAAQMLHQMVIDARDQNINLYVTSGYRDAGHQEILLENNLRENGTHAYNRVAKPGHSEHQLGTTVDLSGATIGYASAAAAFGYTPEGAWLEHNVYRYGFVQSYPSGKQNITGYIYEPWHYRYVGYEVATFVKKNDITLQEYYGDYI